MSLRWILHHPAQITSTESQAESAHIAEATVPITARKAPNETWTAEERAAVRPHAWCALSPFSLRQTRPNETLEECGFRCWLRWRALAGVVGLRAAGHRNDRNSRQVSRSVWTMPRSIDRGTPGCAVQPGLNRTRTLAPLRIAELGKDSVPLVPTRR